MPRLPISAGLLLLLIAGSLPAQEPSRLDPALRLRLRIGVRRATTPEAEATARPSGAPVFGSTRARLPGLAALASGPGGRTFVRTLVRLGPGGQQALQRVGARVAARAGDVVTARIPLEALGALAAEPAIRFMEAAARLEPGAWIPRPAMVRNDRGTEEAGFAGLRRRVGDEFFGLAGQGVIIGIYDSGVDLAHDDFRDGNGRSRVLYAWDQTATDGTPPGAVAEHTLDYGHECDGAAIDAGECPLIDLAGHGTHVAGIAAGDGSATGNGLPAYRFTGAAPAADLIVVKGGDAAFTTDRVAEGVAYIFARAAELGRPAVVNLSLGTQQGPHDGTTLFEDMLNELVGPGGIIVASAGNQGANGNREMVPGVPAQPALHAMGRVAASDAVEHRLSVPRDSVAPGSMNDGAALELWYAGGDSLTITVETPGGDAASASTGDTILVETPGGAIAIDNAFGGPSRLNGDHQALIALFDADESAPPEPGDWTIRVEGAAVHGTGDYHLWLVGHTLSSGLATAALEGGTSNTHLVTSPATADGVLAVAAYTTRHEWQGRDGATAVFPLREQLGDIAYFSSPGPRRDGALKPMIAAPGKVVVSARGADADLWKTLSYLVEEDGVHASLLGTSMAAAFVTGAVAVLLQLDPGLSPTDARELLTAAAREDAFTRHPYTGEEDAVPNAQWGHGKLDVATAARALNPLGLLLPGERVNLSQNPVRSDELVINYAERPQSLAVYTVTGGRVRGFDRAELGDWFAVWDLENDAGREVANGVYLVVVGFREERVLRKIFVVRR